MTALSPWSAATSAWFAETEILEDYRLRLGWRNVDYDEDTFDFDDYDAEILELGLGYRW